MNKRKEAIDPNWSWDNDFAYSQAVRLENLIFISGQAAIDPSGNVIGVNDFDSQIRQAFRNLETVLKSAGSSLQNVLKVTIYLTDMQHFPKVVEYRKRYFQKPYPADTIVEVKKLALPELMIEIEAVACTA